MRLLLLERYRSGQTGQTVNLLAYAFNGSNPFLSTTFKTSGFPKEIAGFCFWF